MNPNLKRFLFIFVIVAVVNFTLFYFLEEDQKCVLEWGSDCSKFIIRTTSQVIFMTLLFYWLTRKKKPTRK